MEIEEPLSSRSNLSHQAKDLKAKIQLLKKSQVRCQLLTDSSTFSLISNKTGKVSTVSTREGQEPPTLSTGRECSPSVRVLSKRKRDNANSVKSCAS